MSSKKITVVLVLVAIEVIGLLLLDPLNIL